MEKLPRTPKIKPASKKINAVGTMGPKLKPGEVRAGGKSLIPKKYLASPNLKMWIDKWTREGTSIRDIIKVHTPFHGKEGNT